MYKLMSWVLIISIIINVSSSGIGLSLRFASTFLIMQDIIKTSSNNWLLLRYVYFVLSKQISAIILFIPFQEGSLCLHNAARNGHVGVVKALLEKGVPVDIKNKVY